MYEDFIKEFDSFLKPFFIRHEKYIKCKKGCSKCCEEGDYPFSVDEFRYLTKGYISLPNDKKTIVQNNIDEIIKSGQKNYKCPFLIDNECCVYEYRGIICRTFGLCYFDDENNYVRLPECVYQNLNYSQYFDPKENLLKIQDVPQINLRIDKILNSDLAKKHNVQCEEIRSLIDWIKPQK